MQYKSTHLKWKYRVGSKKHHLRQLHVFVGGQDTLNKQIWVAAVVYEPCKISN